MESALVVEDFKIRHPDRSVTLTPSSRPERAAYTRHPDRSAQPITRHPDRSTQPIPVIPTGAQPILVIPTGARSLLPVIPTGATDGLIVRCAVEGPPHFAFVCSPPLPVLCLSFRSAAEESASSLAVACSPPELPKSCHPERSSSRPLRAAQSKDPDEARTTPIARPFSHKKLRFCLCRREQGASAPGLFFAPPASKTPANPLVKPPDTQKFP